jgi:hypothetical protein
MHMHAEHHTAPHTHLIHAQDLLIRQYVPQREEPTVVADIEGHHHWCAHDCVYTCSTAEYTSANIFRVYEHGYIALLSSVNKYIYIGL